MKHEWNFAQASGLAVLLLASVFFIYGGQPAPFLYFQF
jgi:hypothetical protein